MTKTDFDAKLSSLTKKISQNKAKHLLVESELNKLKTFEEDGTLNYLVFQLIYRYFKVFQLYTILNMFQNGNLKGCLVKVLRQFLHLIIVLIQH